MVIDERELQARIAEVVDPELDQSLSTLGFVDQVAVRGAAVEVSLRLPTYWCAANFAYIMAEDLRERIGRVAGVESVTVRLRDHYAEDEITAGINAGRSFSAVFPGDTDADLEELRHTFARKAFLIRQEQLMRALLRAGVPQERLAALRMEDACVEGDALLVRVGAAPEDGAGTLRLPGQARLLALLRSKRAAAGLATTGEGPLFTTAEGDPLPPDGVQEHLRAARMVRLNGAFNTLVCSGLYRSRYGEATTPGMQEPDY
jgi:metal-sulfur cluster biosynthetic enzyme